MGDSCLSCAAAVTEVADLGRLYLPDWVNPGEPRGERHPLRLVLCGGCTLLQLGDPVPRAAVLHERYGFASGLNEANVADLRSVAEYALRRAPDPGAWLDIGCNDGTLLSAVPAGVHRAGVDPLAQFAARARAHADQVITGYFRPGDFGAARFDVVTSTAMFYALPDPAAFTEGVREVLAPGGAWVIQQNYALDMLRNNVIDNIIHEHVAYYTVRSLQHLMRRHGLEITDVTYSDPGIKGGCVRTLVCHRGARPVEESVSGALAAESAAAAARPETWRHWCGRVLGQMAKTRSFLEGHASAGKTIYCYGAGNRGGTLVQLIGAAPGTIPFAVERSPAKVGKTWTSAGIPVISEEQMRTRHPDYLLMSPWFFRDGFVRRERSYLESGGRMIFPLPQFEVTGA
jgi:NDP-4-keto-2,6-dideoxyhexose 3-C-methyltransferase